MAFCSRSLKYRIALLVGLVALVAALLAASTTLYPMREQVRGLVGQHEIAVLASTAAALDQEISAKQTLLRAIAESAALHPDTSAHVLQQFLENHSVLREEFANAVVFDVAGKVIANLSDRRAIGDTSAGSSKLFRATIATREGGISPPFSSPLSGRPTVLLVEPVTAQDGTVDFVLGGALSLVNPHFMGQFNTSRPGPTAYFYLIDERGTIVYHPDSTRVLQNVWTEPGGITAVTRRALEGFEGWTEGITKDGERALIAATHLHHTGWTLAVVYPVKEAYRPLRKGEKAAWLSMGIVTLLAAVAGLWLTELLFKPLKRLQDRVEMLFAGRADIDVLDSSRPDEIGQLSRAFFALSRQRHEAEQRLALLTRTDTLTGLNNRRMFEAELPAGLARARRHNIGLALAFLDVDHFKQINDTLGHSTGDQVLVEFAQRLQSSVREVDIVARLSGDEFVILFERVESTADVETMVDKLLGAIRRPFHCSGNIVAVTATVGVAHGSPFVSASHLLDIADEALYEAKAAGRNTYALRSVGETPVLTANQLADTAQLRDG